MPRPPRNWKPLWLDAYRQTLTASDACKVVGVSRSGLYNALQQDEDFAVAKADVDAEILDAVEREIHRRGVDGWDEPVFQGKELVGHVRKYSDRMLELRAKALAPERYRERVDVSGKIDHGDLAGMSDDELRRIAGSGR